MKLTYIVQSGLDVGALTHKLQQLLKYKKHILVEVVTEGRSDAPQAPKVPALLQEKPQVQVQVQAQVSEAYRFSD